MRSAVTAVISGRPAGGTVLYHEIKINNDGTFKFTKKIATDLIHKYIKDNLDIYTCLDLAHYYR